MRMHQFIRIFSYSPLQPSWKGGILVSPCPSVRLSVSGQNHVRSVSSTILIRSIAYMHILSSNFRRCVACNDCFKIMANSLNLWFSLCLLLTWDPIWLNGMGNHEAAVSLERGRSSCSSSVYLLIFAYKTVHKKTWIIVIIFTYMVSFRCDFYGLTN